MNCGHNAEQMSKEKALHVLYKEEPLPVSQLC